MEVSFSVINPRNGMGYTPSTMIRAIRGYNVTRSRHERSGKSAYFSFSFPRNILWSAQR